MLAGPGEPPREPDEFEERSQLRTWLGRHVGNKVFRVAVFVAVPNALVAAALAQLKTYPRYSAEVDRFTVSTEVFTSFTFLVGLFLAFRASQAYYRSWEGATATFHVMADIFDVASSLVAFSKSSKVEKHRVKEFHHILVRLFSVLHALMAAELESQGEVTGREKAWRYELIDATGLDELSLRTLAAAPHKVDLVLHWVQSLVIQAMQAEIICVPAPVLSRAFQELSSAMVQFHTALRIVEVPFPHPYKVATELILLIHYGLTPMAAGEWTDSVYSAAFIAFVQVFMLRSLNSMAAQLDNPFGTDDNDLPMEQMHVDMNSRLLMLLYDETQRVPTISTNAKMHVSRLSDIALEPCGRIQAAHLHHTADDVCAQVPAEDPKGLRQAARGTQPAKHVKRKDKRRAKKGRQLSLATLFSGSDVTIAATAGVALHPEVDRLSVGAYSEGGDAPGAHCAPPVPILSSPLQAPSLPGEASLGSEGGDQLVAGAGADAPAAPAGEPPGTRSCAG